METPTEARFEARGLDSDDDRSWFRVGRDAGYIAGVGFLVTTVLYLLDAANILGLEATFRRTSAGATQDEANFWAAQFAHMHRILWDVIARDTIGPLAWVALIVLGLAIRRIAGANRPGTQLMALFLLVGGVLQITNSLLYLGDVEFWRITGWSGHPNPVAMVAVGRASVAIGNLTLWPEAFGYLVLAAGLVCLGRLCRSSDELPSQLGALAYSEAALITGAGIAEMLHAGNAQNVLLLVVGVLLGPAIAFWLARRFQRLARGQTSDRGAA